MKRISLTMILCATALVTACDDDGPTPPPDAAPPASDAASADGSSPAADGGTDAPAAADGGADAAVSDGSTSDTLASDGAVADAAPLTTTQARGQYLVRLLGCGNCHTPFMADGKTPDTSKAFSGRECFVKDPASGGCLNSANLTNDDSGIKKLTDDQVINAFTKGMDPEGGGKFLFSQMPYYQFANLSNDDAKAIVDYLRIVTPVAHELTNTAPYDKQPTAAEWSPVLAADLPMPGAGAPAGAANGKYLASLSCLTCHTVDATVTAGMPKHLDAAKAFQGGRNAMTTVAMMMKTIQSANLTPDATGLKDWTADQIVAAIKMAKDDKGRMLCSPMRAFTTMSDADATDIASYLRSIPPVANQITAMCQ